MKQEEQNVVTCGTCGYKWEVGSVSFHSCTEELQRELRRVRSVAVELRDKLDTLGLVVGLTAFKHESQRAVLQEALDVSRKAIAESKEVLP